MRYDMRASYCSFVGEITSLSLPLFNHNDPHGNRNRGQGLDNVLTPSFINSVTAYGLT